MVSVVWLGRAGENVILMDTSRFWPTVALLTVIVGPCGAGVTVSDSVALACCAVGVEVSVTPTFTIVIPAVVGVPLIVLPFKVKPAGNGEAVQVKGGTPPLAVST
jgi:hypothetical protein